MTEIDKFIVPIYFKSMYHWFENYSELRRTDEIVSMFEDSLYAILIQIHNNFVFSLVKINVKKKN